MKICFLAKNLAIGTGNDGYGGYRRMAFEIISGLKKNLNCEIFLLAEKISGFPRDIKTIEGINLNIKGVTNARRAMKKCDIVFCLDVWPTAVLGWLANLGLNKKMVIATVGTASVKPLYQPVKGFLMKKSLRSADVVTAISRFVASQIEKVAPEIKIKVIHLGVDSKFSAARESSSDVSEKARKFKPYILSVGDVRDRKGYHISIKAFAESLTALPDLNYVIVGYRQDNNYVKFINNLVEKNNLTNKVHFLQDIPDEYLRELYRNAELFILLPINVGFDFEGFGLVFLEAAAAGLASIATGNNGSEDAVIAGETGLVVPQGDDSTASQAIIRLMSDKNLRNEMGRKGQEFAGRMTWHETAEKYAQICNALI